VRAEGIAELLGDLLMTCTGGTPTSAGAQVPTINITIALNTQVTSRLITTSGVLVSDALLLIKSTIRVLPLHLIPYFVLPMQPMATFAKLLSLVPGQAVAGASTQLSILKPTFTKALSRRRTKSHSSTCRLIRLVIPYSWAAKSSFRFYLSDQNYKCSRQRFCSRAA
jgi:hypothetical protein